MKKIAVLHASNTLNYGTMMMVTNFIYYLNKQNNSKISFYIDNDEIDGLKRIQEGAKYEKVHRLSDFGIINKPTKKSDSLLLKTFKYFKFALNYGKKFKSNKISNVIVLGGDDFSEYYPLVGVVIEFLKIRSIKRQGVEVFLIGQTIGPFTGWRKKMAMFFLKNIPIYTRDFENYKYLKDHLKVNFLSHSKDLAFLDLPLQNPKRQSEQSLSIGSKKTIVLVISGIWHSYTNDKSSYIKNWVSIINRLYERYNIILLAHVLTDRSSDKIIIDETYESLSSEVKKSIQKITEVILPSEARRILSDSHFSITGRMHAAVSSYQVNKPSIALSYSVKYKGVLGELNRSDLIIESNDDDLWANNTISENVIKKVDYVESNYLRISKEISDIMPSVQLKVIEMVEDISNKLH